MPMTKTEVTARLDALLDQYVEAQRLRHFSTAMKLREDILGLYPDDPPPITAVLHTDFVMKPTQREAIKEAWTGIKGTLKDSGLIILEKGVTMHVVYPTHVDTIGEEKL